jgi:hypothetical protein
MTKRRTNLTAIRKGKGQKKRCFPIQAAPIPAFFHAHVHRGFIFFSVKDGGRAKRGGGDFLFFVTSFMPKEVTKKGQKKRCFHARAAPIPVVLLGLRT